MTQTIQCLDGVPSLLENHILYGPLTPKPYALRSTTFILTFILKFNNDLIIFNNCDLVILSTNACIVEWNEVDKKIQISCDKNKSKHCLCQSLKPKRKVFKVIFDKIIKTFHISCIVVFCNIIIDAANFTKKTQKFENSPKNFRIF